MLIALMGDNCVGKSSVAERLQHALRARAFSGRDYLRLEKNEQTARASFQKMLADAVSDENIIYVIFPRRNSLPCSPRAVCGCW